VFYIDQAQSDALQVYVQIFTLDFFLQVLRHNLALPSVWVIL